MRQEGRGIDQQRVGQRHAEGSRRNMRLLATNLTERGGTICTRGSQASPKGGEGGENGGNTDEQE